MNKPTLPKVTDEIASLRVTPETWARFAWPLAGLLQHDVAGEDDVLELADRLDLVLPRFASTAEVGAEADAIITLCRSKSRAKPGARAVLLLAALGGPVPDKVVAAVAAALSMAERDLKPRRHHRVEGVTDDTGLQVIERLSALAGGKAGQGALRGVRCAIYDLIASYHHQGKIAHATAINALACYVGLLDPRTGTIDFKLLSEVALDHGLPAIVAVADSDRIALAKARTRYREVLLGELTNPQRQQVRRLAVDSPAFDRAVDRAIVAVVRRQDEHPQASSHIVEEARKEVLDQSLAVVADLIGVDLEQMALEDDDGEVARSLERARPRSPRARQAVVGVGASTAAEIRTGIAYQRRVALPVRPAAPIRDEVESAKARARVKRIDKQGRAKGHAKSLSMFADPDFVARVDSELATLTRPVAEQPKRRRAAARPARP